jgi:hypothetical protein
MAGLNSPDQPSWRIFVARAQHKVESKKGIKLFTYASFALQYTSPLPILTTYSHIHKSEQHAKNVWSSPPFTLPPTFRQSIFDQTFFTLLQ